MGVRLPLLPPEYDLSIEQRDNYAELMINLLVKPINTLPSRADIRGRTIFFGCMAERSNATVC